MFFVATAAAKKNKRFFARPPARARHASAFAPMALRRDKGAHAVARQKTDAKNGGNGGNGGNGYRVVGARAQMRAAKYRKHTSAGKISLQTPVRGNAKTVSIGFCLHTLMASGSPASAQPAWERLRAASRAAINNYHPRRGEYGAAARRPRSARFPPNRLKPEGRGGSNAAEGDLVEFPPRLESGTKTPEVFSGVERPEGEHVSRERSRRRRQAQAR